MAMHQDLVIPEILAPAGGREQFFAALNAGADAVFLGLKSFNARARAENFSTEDLFELVPLAHRYGMKVLVTVNVLIKEAEIPQLVELLADLEAAEVDAIIVQDLGVARLARACFPGLRLHASTQMAVHNLAGVLQAKELGFRRVVLAREMTALELRKIRGSVPREEVELEAFCHGSLCYSYSGLCFFSGAEDARSGNRGECAYTCRQPYRILEENKSGFLFSMRDLDTSKDLEHLVRSGIDTLKIEGRKKDAQYVASTVRLYRAKLDEFFGRSTLRPEAPQATTAKVTTVDDKMGDSRPVPGTATLEQDLALTFQRQPTTFFLKGRYHENVIDLAHASHLGVEVGRVSAVLGHTVKVFLSQPVERFDGLRILSPTHQDLQKRYDNDHLEFSLREMTLRGKRVFAADAGREIEILLPKEKALPRKGDTVYKTRSADLKRRVTQLATPPQDAKLRPLKTIGLSFEAIRAGESLELSAHVLKQGEWIKTASISLPAEKARGVSTLLRDLRSTFEIMGTSGFQAPSISYQGDDNWFVPRSLLKKLREKIEVDLSGAFDAWRLERKRNAELFLKGGSCGDTERVEVVQKISLSPPKPSFAIKTDRLETLRDVLAYRTDYPTYPLGEVIFEPKRAFLPEFDPMALARELVTQSDTHHVALRIALPTVVRAWDEPLLARWVKTLYQQGVRRFEIGNVGGFQLLKAWGIDLRSVQLSGDFTLYALNSCSTRAWLEMGLGQISLSVEDDYKNATAHLAQLSNDEKSRLSAILFKDTPLFIAEACSLTALHQGCPTSKVCGYRTLTIENPKGDRFYVAHESCKSVVYGHEPYALTHKQEALLDLGITNFRIDFLTRAYDNRRVYEILDATCSQVRLADTHSANWDRSLL